MSYKKIRTKTVPASITVKKAASIAGKRPNYVNDEISRDKLNYGFSFDEMAYAPGDENKPEDDNDKGQILVVCDAKWHKWLRRIRKEETATN